MEQLLIQLNLTIKVTGVNDAPSAANDTGYIAEGSTLTVANGGAAVSGTSTGSNSGDLLENDTDLDVTADTSGNVTESSDDVLTVTVGGTVPQNGGTDSSGDAVTQTVKLQQLVQQLLVYMDL